jgi:endonuclease/exonuclease/phosphatase family metal-dependent hydrolase
MPRERSAFRRAVHGVLALALTAGFAQVAAGASRAASGPATGTAERPAAVLPAGPPPVARPAGPPPVARLSADTGAKALGSGWQSSGDLAWTTSGDGDGFHVLVADAAHGYAWRTIATLAVPGVETDLWIGNACVTGSGRRAVVAYAPRTFTNDATLFERGAFTAVVDLRTGAVRPLRVRTSLAYFNPGCGPGETAVLTQGGTEDLHRTRLVPVDAAHGTLARGIEVPGQLTSAVPTPTGIVAADSGALVRVSADGTRRVLAATAGVPYRLTPDAGGGVVYLERDGAAGATARRASATPGVKPRTLATGERTALDIAAGRGGQVSVLGTGRAAAVPGLTGVALVDAPAQSQVSTGRRLAVTSVLPTGNPDPRAPVADPGVPRPVTIATEALASGSEVTFAHTPAAHTPAAGAARAVRALGDPTDPGDLADRYCSVPRNDPRNQAMQPKPRQVEWAVDQAVRESLYVQRPANWKGLGMPAYTPQGLFPPIGLDDGGYVPAQVMLGIAAQESNLWQAARYAVPGVTANPLIGNYYGLDIYNGTTADDWSIRWDKADCGYGVTQVTDHMRLAGREKGPEDAAWPYQTQRAVALDFAANVAAGVQILARKWNEVAAAHLFVNNGDSSKIENWFYAVWAYNSGFHPYAGENNPWGLGWGNNPINPNYLANRRPFLEDTYEDARNPQRWPYPEKIMGWAGHPVEVLEAPDVLVPGYRAAWWPGEPPVAELRRAAVKPPRELFCDQSSDCYPGTLQTPDADEVVGEPAGPCAHRDAAGHYDLKCWYHRPAAWKTDCDLTCGHELVRFDPGYAYQDDGTAYPPLCTLDGLPAGARVIDDVPDGTPSVRPNCPRAWSNAGTFALTYPPDAAGHHPGKIDTHQLGTGFGGHLWMTNARPPGDQLAFEASWRFDAPVTGLARVYAALPVVGAGTAATTYRIRTRYGWRDSTVRQKGTGNRWVQLGIFPFDGPPEVRLSNAAPDGDGSQRVAIDAVAVAPVAATTVKVLHWNLAGAARNDGDPDVVQRLLQQVQLTHPDVLSINEACEEQYDYLVFKLDEMGYHMAGTFDATQLTNPTCFNIDGGSLRAGNAVLARTTGVATSKIYGFDTDLLIPDKAGTGRGVACLTVRIPATDRNTKVCSTHLSQQAEGDHRYAEVRELARVFGPEARQMPFVLAGDLNIVTPPRDGALGTLYGSPAGTGDFLELDGERDCLVAPACVPAQGGTATHQEGELGDGDGRPDTKIDYIFTSRWFSAVPVGRASVDVNVGLCGAEPFPCSDHFLYAGEVQLAAG